MSKNLVMKRTAAVENDVVALLKHHFQFPFIYSISLWETSPVDRTTEIFMRKEDDWRNKTSVYCFQIYKSQIRYKCWSFLTLRSFPDQRESHDLILSIISRWNGKLRHQNRKFKTKDVPYIERRVHWAVRDQAAPRDHCRAGPRSVNLVGTFFFLHLKTGDSKSQPSTKASHPM